jgi:OOP family OmpA-OmpF porin
MTKTTRPRSAVLLTMTVSALGMLAQGSPEARALFAKDVAKSADSPLTGRYAGSVILAQTVKDFDELTLPTGPAVGETYDNNKKFKSTVTAQGRVTRTIYIAPLGRSALEVTTNFAETIAAKGFQPVFRCSGPACGPSFTYLKYRWDRPETKVLGTNYEHTRKLMVDAAFDQMVDLRYTLFKKTEGGADSYIALYSGLHRGGQFGDFSAALADRTGVLVEIVEPRAMDRRMVVVNAAEIGGKVASEGRAVFYGIEFDFDKADLKPASATQLAEMAKFLKSNAAARVYIVGHTDSKGSLDHNLTLSTQRAQSVVNALVTQYGIDTKRLIPRGLGPLAPVASNRSEAGQAKNRRVEMVEQ